MLLVCPLTTPTSRNRDSLGNPVLRECAHDLRCYVHKPLIPATILLYPVALPSTLHAQSPSTES